MKKKILIFGLIIASFFSLTSCDNNSQNPDESGNNGDITNDNYSAKVVYPDGTPVNANASVQWCKESCYLPVKVNDKGVAEIDLEDDGTYYVHLESIPSGYTYNPNIYTTDKDNKNITINLLALSSYASGDGSKQNPYAVTTGAYSASFASAGSTGAIYYAFTTTEAGTYVFESMAVDKLAVNVIDPTLGFYGTDLSKAPSQDKDSGQGSNFKMSFEAVASTKYYFAILVSSASSFPANFDFTITKA